MFRKISAALLLTAGIALALWGYNAYRHPVTLSSCAESPDGALDPSMEGQLVITNGRISFGKGASDPMFGIETDSLILIRTVEMYQYMDDEAGNVTEGFSTEHEILSSLGLQNPPFPQQLKSEVFIAEDIRIGSQLGLSPEYAKKFALDSYSFLSGDYPLEDFTELPYMEMSGPELTSFNGFYASPGSSWEIGDLKVSYRVLDAGSLGEFTAVGRQHSGILVPNGPQCGIYDRPVSAAELFPSLTDAARTVFIICASAGSLLVMLSVILFAAKRKKA